MANFQDSPFNFRVPESSAGHLYYVRLKSQFGLFYKLGFTTKASVEERLAYKGNGDEKSIDQVLCFEYFEDALNIESALHTYFEYKAVFRGKRDRDMPLYENGQSELYTKDILELDNKFDLQQEWNTKGNIFRFNCKRSGSKTDEEIERDVQNLKWHFDHEHKIKEIVKLPWPFNWIDKFLVSISGSGETGSDKEKREFAMCALERVRDSIEISRVNARIARSKKLHELTCELRLFEEAQENKKAASRIIEALKTDVQAAIDAFMNRNLDAFEKIIDIDLFAYNLADAMTANFTFSSDYIGIANNCYLVELMKAMSNGENPRDLLLKPVEDTYKYLLRHLVRDHQLYTEELIIPDDPIYSSENEDVPTGLSDYFAPRVFLECFGRDWILLDIPPLTDGEGWIEFPVLVRNSKFNFNGYLTVRASRCAGNKIGLSFPNFLGLDEAACVGKWEYENAILGPEGSKAGGEFWHRNQLKVTDEERDFYREVMGLA